MGSNIYKTMRNIKTKRNNIIIELVYIFFEKYER